MKRGAEGETPVRYVRVTLAPAGWFVGVMMHFRWLGDFGDGVSPVEGCVSVTLV